MKRVFSLSLALLLSISILTGCGSKGLEQQVANLANEVETLTKENSDLKAKVATLTKENSDLTAIIEPYKSLSEAEIKAKEAAAVKQAELDKIQTEKLQSEQEDKRKAEAEKAKKEADAKAKQGYNTGITYNQLARTPEKYSEAKVKFTGEVVQVIEGDDLVQIRLAVDSDYNKIIFGYYSSDIVSSRVLVNDRITIYGTSQELYTYTSTMGGEITIPLVSIEKIDVR